MPRCVSIPSPEKLKVSRKNWDEVERIVHDNMLEMIKHFELTDLKLGTVLGGGKLTRAGQSTNARNLRTARRRIRAVDVIRLARYAKHPVSYFFEKHN